MDDFIVFDEEDGEERPVPPQRPSRNTNNNKRQTILLQNDPNEYNIARDRPRRSTRQRPSRFAEEDEDDYEELDEEPAPAPKRGARTKRSQHPQQQPPQPPAQQPQQPPKQSRTGSTFRNVNNASDRVYFADADAIRQRNQTEAWERQMRENEERLQQQLNEEEALQEIEQEEQQQEQSSSEEEEEEEEVKEPEVRVSEAKKIINFAEGGDRRVCLPDTLAAKLKPHQLDGIRFCWKHIVIAKEKHLKGCILAHSMGLGKTLQIISVCYMFIKERQHGGGKRILICCPKSVLLNWKNEFTYWMRVCKLEDSFNVKQNLFVLDERINDKKKREKMLSTWASNGGVLLMTPMIFAKLTGQQRALKEQDPNQLHQDYLNQKQLYKRVRRGQLSRAQRLNRVNHPPKPKKQKTAEQEMIQSKFTSRMRELLYTTQLCIVDEGSGLKSKKTKFSRALSRIPTKNRILLTGTPLQNNLEEYFNMVDFVRRGYWTLKDFRTLFARPIQEGFKRDSSLESVDQMKKQSYILVSELKKMVDRRDQQILLDTLPKKFEHVISFKLSNIQKKLYELFLQSKATESYRSNVIYLACMLGKIVNHPDMLLLYCKRNQIHNLQDQEERERKVRNGIVSDHEEEEEEDGGRRNGQERKKKKRRKSGGNGRNNHREQPPREERREEEENQVDDKQRVGLVQPEVIRIDDDEDLFGDNANLLSNLIKSESSSQQLSSQQPSSQQVKQEIKSEVKRERQQQQVKQEVKRESRVDNDLLDSILDGTNNNTQQSQTPSTSKKRKRKKTPPTLSSSSSSEDDDDDDDEERPKSRVNNDLIDSAINASGNHRRNNRRGHYHHDSSNINQQDISDEEKEELQQIFNGEDDANDGEDYAWAKPVLQPSYKQSRAWHSPKMELLLRLCQKCYQHDEKMLIFTQYTEMIDVMEDHMNTYQFTVDQQGTRRVLQNEMDYLRLDGSCTSKERQRMIDEFNGSETRVKFFLISTLAGGQGINLTAASRVVVFDVTWDPTWSSQSIFRAYRFGQTRPVHIYRFVTAGTVEENIWLRCVAKMWLFKRIVDNRIPERKISIEDLDLFNSNGVDTRTRSDQPLLDPKVYGQDDMLKELFGNERMGDAHDHVNRILYPFDVTEQDIAMSQMGVVDIPQQQEERVDVDEQEAMRNGGEFDVMNKIASCFHFESLYLDDLKDKLTDEQGEASLREYEARELDRRRVRMTVDAEYNSQESDEDEDQEMMAGGDDHGNGGGGHGGGGIGHHPIHIPPQPQQPLVIDPVVIDEPVVVMPQQQQQEEQPVQLSQDQLQQRVQQMRQLLMM